MFAKLVASFLESKNCSQCSQDFATFGTPVEECFLLVSPVRSSSLFDPSNF